jgi:hypothetical protein
MHAPQTYHCPKCGYDVWRVHCAHPTERGMCHLPARDGTRPALCWQHRDLVPLPPVRGNYTCTCGSLIGGVICCEKTGKKHWCHLPAVSGRRPPRCLRHSANQPPPPPPPSPQPPPAAGAVAPPIQDEGDEPMDDDDVGPPPHHSAQPDCALVNCENPSLQ